MKLSSDFKRFGIILVLSYLSSVGHSALNTPPLSSALSMIEWKCDTTSFKWWNDPYEKFKPSRISNVSQPLNSNCALIKTQVIQLFLKNGFFIFEPEPSSFHQMASTAARKEVLATALKMYPSDFYLEGIISSQESTVEFALEAKSSVTHQPLMSLAKTIEVKRSGASLDDERFSFIVADFITPLLMIIEKRKHLNIRYVLTLTQKSSISTDQSLTCLRKKINSSESIELRGLHKNFKVFELSSSKAQQEVEKMIQNSKCLGKTSWQLSHSDAHQSSSIR